LIPTISPNTLPTNITSAAQEQTALQNQAAFAAQQAQVLQNLQAINAQQQAGTTGITTIPASQYGSFMSTPGYNAGSAPVTPAASSTAGSTATVSRGGGKGAIAS
jgi:hypothetical protein